MIILSSKESCCGCTACSKICPRSCIQMKEDSEGFLYPTIDTDSCIECSLCEKVCPVLEETSSHTPITVYAAKNREESVRKESSSGGIFTLIAEEVIKQGGVVFGARFNSNWEVVHDYAEDVKGLSNFRGSKYTQSQINNSFPVIADFLKEKRVVLFSGTPCQVKGLKKYLRKEYENLLTVDFICHGVPSPKVWKKYLTESHASRIKDIREEESTNSKVEGCNITIESINFRDKIWGWNNFSFTLQLGLKIGGDKRRTIRICEPFTKNSFMRLFLSDICLRPSCHTCCAKSGKSHSDITLADFWGIQCTYPSKYDEGGVSWVATMSNKGENYINKIKIRGDYSKCDFERSIIHNPAYNKSCIAHPKRGEFFTQIGISSIDMLAKRYCKPSIKSVIINKTKQLIKRIIGRK